MAYQARQREPLLDSNMQAALERRSKELLGLGLAVCAVLFALMLASYTPDDPSWLTATDEPAQNWLGRFGASIASPLFIIVGFGAWGLPLVLATWGGRLMLHLGEERALSRVIFAPIAIAMAAVFASTYVPGADWTHSFGLGGLFGDTVLGAVLGVAPVKATFGLNVMSFVMGIATFGMALFVLGFTLPELREILRLVLVGIVLAYAYTMMFLRKGYRATARSAQAARENRAARKQAARLAAEEAQIQAEEAAYLQASLPFTPEVTAPAKRGEHRVLRAEPTVTHADDDFELIDDEPEPDAPRKPSMLGRMFARKPAQPKAHAAPVMPVMPTEAPLPIDDGDERIKAKIADVIKSRVRQTQPLVADRRLEPSLTRGRGPQPLIMQKPVQAQPAVEAPAEPVLRAPAPLAVEDYGYQPDDVDDGYMPEDYAYDEAPAPQTPAPGAVAQAPVANRVIPTAAVQKPVVQHAPRKPVQPSRQAQAEAQPALQLEPKSHPAYELPPLSLLRSPGTIQRHHLSDEALEENARMLENVLDDYGVKGEIVSVRPGPVVTMYELEPAPGLKASRVIGLADDIARSMSALSARVSTVPGRSVIGIELPNENREMVVLREILAARDFGDSNMKLPLALGKNIGGDPIVANLAKMPHLLIAGTTGSGKSVAINTMILSLLYKLSPEECRLIMIDPKMLELSVYDGIPHLLSPVVTDPKKAVVALKWVVAEMEERYRKMSKMGVRNIDGYNGRVKETLAKGEMFSRTVQTGFDDDTGEPVFETEEFAPEVLPYIVVIVDEMADLMMVAGKEIEACIQRLAQMARASGIHLIMATQRPSVDVITGTIKANFPTRISFQVTSKIDSRTILGEMGAEQLLGMGDMLYMAGGSKITRVHGPFCSDEEVEEIVNYLKSFGPPEYMNGVVEGVDEDKADDIDAVLGLGGNTTGEDALYDQAVAVVIKDRKCSTSYIQRKLAIGYNKAARLVEQMEEEGLISAANHVGKREILVPEQQ
ncbi:DNA translocase FtsK [Pseudoruegeria sp. SHC-113]|uniref:DNA translocase FtsK n=1 Tax=Pseudoruegeria sp. SHC-113 TaxID=2855439 RepID=UPI0021BB3BB1|nr:DNA translocase FtsK 4TM domain-containing protein [Pseudoruegeria sp. SHC-113]MCT8158470.1 DNA translocase FtsK 4TM domain-containing protein [Pseudoruegeria sp. SHC-113]